MNADITATIDSLARQADILVFGETHGTREVPQVLGQWLSRLENAGYGALALEVPRAEQGALRAWAQGTLGVPPQFFTHPVGDGRGNEQVLALVHAATSRGWALICFDEMVMANWRTRDQKMAENLVAEWQRCCPDQKVVGICGNLHSRLTPAPDLGERFWPSFAAQAQRLLPQRTVRSINVVFHQGQYFNLGRRSFRLPPIDAPYITTDEADGHTLTLHLPRATPVTHLAPPAHLGCWALFLLPAQVVVACLLGLQRWAHLAMRRIFRHHA
jgi:hypothetical protein